MLRCALVFFFQRRVLLHGVLMVDGAALIGAAGRVFALAPSRFGLALQPRTGIASLGGAPA